MVQTAGLKDAILTFLFTSSLSTSLSIIPTILLTLEYTSDDQICSLSVSISSYSTFPLQFSKGSDFSLEFLKVPQNGSLSSSLHFNYCETSFIHNQKKNNLFINSLDRECYYFTNITGTVF